MGSMLNENGILSGLGRAVHHYQGRSLFLFMGFIMLLLLSVRRGRKNRVLFTYPFILEALLLFNPLTARFLSGEAEEVTAGMAYYFWLFPAVLLLAYGTVSLMAELQKLSMKIPLLLAVLLLSFLTCVPPLSAYSKISLPANIKKADPELLSISEYLDAHTSEDRYRVVFERGRQAMEAGELNARMVPEPFLLDAGRKMDGKAVEERLAKLKGAYIVCDSHGELSGYLFALRITRVAHTPYSSVYYIP